MQALHLRAASPVPFDVACDPESSLSTGKAGLPQVPFLVRRISYINVDLCNLLFTNELSLEFPALLLINCTN